MKRFFSTAIFFLAANGAALAAATTDGSGALSLAALASKYSPTVKPAAKAALAKLADGHAKIAFPKGKTIDVVVDAVSCRASNVDITQHACELTFGEKKVQVAGRLAHEIFATLLEVGVPPDGAAGTIYAAVSALDCTVDPDEITQKAGGGAQCKYEPPK
ncbi:hypothetical protein IY145_07995 [Methylosinus sp. H3A]|uniref:hypothetical protein n=1 Tax=Methylosinus sp. H3A TaxID=2785786 RepID=UPI0018C2C181|nr:hypothetical protein [Methylosinus sp. H3A]MBG0809317.1 hypothetical protein [Methylosinus sp. H3A]